MRAILAGAVLMTTLALPAATLAQDARPIRRSATQSATGTAPTSPATMPDTPRVVGSLFAVLALIVLLRWAGKRFARGSAFGRSAGAVQVLGRSYVSAKQQIVLVQVGRRLLVIGDGGQQLSTLCEISDPDEVAAVIGQVRGGGGSASADAAAPAFSDVLRRAGERFRPTAPAAGAEVDPNPDVATTRQELAGLAARVRSVSNHLKGT